MSISQNPSTRIYVYLLFLPFLFGTIDMAAATAFTFAVDSEGTYSASRHGRLVSDGSRWRIDYDPSTEVRAHDSLIGRGGERRIALNHSNKTWYYVDPGIPTIAIPTLFNFYRSSESRATKARVGSAPSSASNANTKTVAFNYNTVTQIGTESVRGEVSGRIVLSPAAFPHENCRELFDAPSTGIPEIDAKLRAALSEVMLANTEKSELTVTRRLDGGPPMTQVIRTTIESLGEVGSRDADFEVPTDYQYQPPLIGSPGGGQ
jgi:hypothetical protein